MCVCTSPSGHATLLRAIVGVLVHVVLVGGRKGDGRLVELAEDVALAPLHVELVELEQRLPVARANQRSTPLVGHVDAVVEVAEPEHIVVVAHVELAAGRSRGGELGLLVDLAKVLVALTDLLLIGGEVGAHEAHRRVVVDEAEQAGALVARGAAEAGLRLAHGHVLDVADVLLEHEDEQADAHELQVLGVELHVVALALQELDELVEPDGGVLVARVHDVLRVQVDDLLEADGEYVDAVALRRPTDRVGRAASELVGQRRVHEAETALARHVRTVDEPLAQAQLLHVAGAEAAVDVPRADGDATRLRLDILRFGGDELAQHRIGQAQERRRHEAAHAVGELAVVARHAVEEGVHGVLFGVVEEVVLDGARQRALQVLGHRLALDGARARVYAANAVAVDDPHLAIEFAEAAHLELVADHLRQLIAQHLDAHKRLHAVRAVQTVHAVGAYEPLLQRVDTAAAVAEEHALGRLGRVVLLVQLVDQVRPEAFAQRLLVHLHG